MTGKLEALAESKVSVEGGGILSGGAFGETGPTKWSVTAKKERDLDWGFKAGMTSWASRAAQKVYLCEKRAWLSAVLVPRGCAEMFAWEKSGF